ncbi:aspartate aminotransferase family protein [Mycobacterium sp. CBMA293]|uniref:aspartate aminotransferase family protein n=4 Tax=Mycolicibacterium TaxID=1866885 RepID=UPI0012DF9398|nr:MULTISPECIES: aspartate aminotransferase family protein [unclassified Mycolicibacterium]MUL47020.1 aspartate aminotransferase family protein [Mycolicibacterium sp. CBMA 360]MUL58396.1 aspartate aminotransferase family protein [Mycolicibacterium sp. CBMA 335]MUL73854.1 aspartate aminotransferase family protein [Mycolicibacterium sp. CBMA 311]MUL93279.1 aspartate aminotransferase family protein [Mycolicibacterium sp. CBMA 230]MUM07826.1 aspartate aminotransferase family protein [Mycolicibacte
MTLAADHLLPAGHTIDSMRAEAARAYELDRAHVFHSWSAQGALKPMTVTAAEGSYVWDGDGNRLLDFSSQLVNTNIGHQHPKVVAAIAEQAAKLCTIAPQHANAARSEAARLLAELTPGDLNRIFFTNGGADAVEHAVRMARLHTGKHKVLSRYRAYHGGTDLAINLTGDPRRFANDRGAAGVVHFNGPFLYRSVFHAETEEQECARALEELQRVIELEGASTIAAIILESIPGTAGIMVPPPGYLAGVRELCNQYGIVMIADEVMAGFGRSGKWFAINHFDVVPDLMTFAKGVNSGYVPLGGVAISPAIAQTFADRAYPGGLTYSGHPLACAAAVATINVMREEGMVDNAARLGEQIIGPALRDFAQRHRSVGEVRGAGVFWAIELVNDQTTREPLAPYGGTSEAMTAVVASCKSQGLLPFTNFNRVHVVPPCNASDDEVRAGLAIVDRALDVADQYAQ